MSRYALKNDQPLPLFAVTLNSTTDSANGQAEWGQGPGNKNAGGARS